MLLRGSSNGNLHHRQGTPACTHRELRIGRKGTRNMRYHAEIFKSMLKIGSERNMENLSCWIFVVTTHKDKTDREVFSGDDIFQQRMKDGFWGLGKNTPN